MNDKPTRHAQICLALNDTYKRKNHDYGDSFAQLRNRLPNAILTRLFDKYLRLETLLNGATQEVKDESINDTLMDMANYCIMELVERGITPNITAPPDTAMEYETTADDMGEEDVGESEPVKVKYEWLSNADLLDLICERFDVTECSKCPLERTDDKHAKCSDEFMNKYPEEFRKIAIQYLEGLEGKA